MAETNVFIEVRGNQGFCKGKTFPVTYGKNGFSQEKIEGDKCTPIGIFTLQTVYYRPDRIATPHTTLPKVEITPHMGWCDDPNAPDYNRLIGKPYEFRHEDLWREDHLYDLLITIDHNTHPTVKDKGSAVFIHVASPHGGPTAGCIGMSFQDLLFVVEAAEANSKISLAVA